MAIKINNTTVIDDSRNITSANSAEFTGTSHIKVPAGTVDQRPGSAVNGMFRYNSTSNTFEGYTAGAWGPIAGSGGGAKTNTVNIGDGSSTSYNVAHQLNTSNVIIVVTENATGYVVYPDVDILDLNNVNIIFYTAPSSSAYKVSVYGF
jgi:hypothetical protein